MNATRILLHRQPMIRFLGKRSVPSKLDHSPQPHPASPSTSLPTSFAAYRQKAQQHGPLNTHFSTSSTNSSAAANVKGGAIGGATGKSLGPVQATNGLFFDLSELPARFRRRRLDVSEIEAVESAGGSMFA